MATDIDINDSNSNQDPSIMLTESLSAAVYDELNGSQYGADAAYFMLNGWTQINVSTYQNTDVHYQGIAWYKTLSNGSTEVVIANRGSCSTYDFAVSDLQIVLGKDPAADQAAVDFYNSVIKYLNQQGIAQDSINVIETGHSLGGQEADYVTAMVDDHDLSILLSGTNNISAITYNAPSIASKDIIQGMSYNAVNLASSSEAVHLGGSTFAGRTVTMDLGNTISIKKSAAAGFAVGGPFGAIISSLVASLSYNHSLNRFTSFLTSHAAFGSVDLTKYPPNTINSAVVQALSNISNEQFFANRNIVSSIFNNSNNTTTQNSNDQTISEITSETFTASVNGNIETVIGSQQDNYTLTIDTNTVTITGGDIKSGIINFSNNGTLASTQISTTSASQSALAAATESNAATLQSTSPTTDGSDLSISSEVWAYADGTIETETFSTTGASSEKTIYASGAYAITTNDGNGNVVTDYYTKLGNVYAAGWSYSDGSSGSTNFITNGLTKSTKLASSTLNVPASSYSILINPDNSFYQENLNTDSSGIISTADSTGKIISTDNLAGTGENFSQNDLTAISSVDSNGNSITRYYDSIGNLVNDTWAYADGTTGSDNFNASGIVTGSANYTDGSKTGYSEISGNKTIDTYSNTGFFINDQWSLKDGASGSDMFSANGNGSGIINHADGSYSSIIYDGSGSITIKNNDAQGNIQSTDTWYANRTHSVSTYTNGQIESTYLYFANGQTQVTNYAKDGSISDQMMAPSGSLINPDGTGFGVLSNTDGSYSVNYTDTDGDTLVFEYNTSGQLSNTAVVQGGPVSIGASTSDGSNWESPYSPTTPVFTDGSGTQWIEFTNNFGKVIADDWTAIDGSYGNDQFNSNGSSTGIHNNADGSYFIYQNDGQGDSETDHYDKNDNKAFDTWSNSNGSYGNDTYNLDGSTSGASYNSDGSYSTYLEDSQFNTTVVVYSASGLVLDDYWGKTDGSSGSDIFNQDGSSKKITLNTDGSSQIEINDGKNNIHSMNFNSTGKETSINWKNTNGSSGNIQYLADGSSQEVDTASDGSFSTIDIDSTGNSVTDNYSSSDKLNSKYWKSTDGISGNTVYNQDGSYQTTVVNTDSSYSITLTDNLGNITTHEFTSDGFEFEYRYKGVDGSSVITQYQKNGAYTTTKQDESGSKEILTVSVDGSRDDKFYDTNSNLISENWKNALGQSGTFKLNTDGTTTATTWQPNGSYEIETTDILNNKTASYYSSQGILLYNIWTDSNGNQSKKVYVDGSESATLFKTDVMYTTSTIQKSGGFIFDINSGGMVYENGVGSAQRSYNFFSGMENYIGNISIQFNPETGYGGNFPGGVSSPNYFSDKSGESIYQPNGSYYFSGSLNFSAQSGFTFSSDQNGNEKFSLPGSNNLQDFPDPNGGINFSTYKVTETVDTATQDNSSIPLPPWVTSISQIESMSQLSNNGCFAIIDGQPYVYNGQEWSYLTTPPGATGFAIVSNGQSLLHPSETVKKETTYQFGYGIVNGRFTENDIISINGYGQQKLTSQSSSWSWIGGHGSNVNGQWMEYLDNGWSYDGNTIRDQNGNIIYQEFNNNGTESIISGGSSLLATGSSVNYTSVNGNKFQYTFSFLSNPDTNSYFTGTEILSGYSWSLVDGTYGSFSYNLNGIGTGITHYSDGSYSTSYDDGTGGYSIKNFSTSDILLSDSIGNDDGSVAQDTFNSDGSSLGSTQFSDGLSSSYTNDGNGNIKTKYYSQDGILVGSGIINTSSSSTNTISLLSSNVSVEFGDQTSKILPANGNDTILGGNGNDTVLTGSGADSITLGNGNDSLYLSSGQSTISLGNGQDTILGTNSNYTISAGDGADSIRLGYGNNQLIAGNGNDTIILGDGSSTITLGDGNDSIYLNNGSDTLSMGSGNCTITTISGNDTLQLGDGSSNITLGTGNSIISAGNGNNNIRVGNGSDTVLLGSGNDSIAASDGNYYLMLGDGTDTIHLGRGSSTLELGGGNDFISIVSGYDTVMAGDGNDTLQLGTASTALTLGNGNNLILASSGNNTIQVGDGANKIVSGNGANMIYAGDGMDSIYLGTGLDSVILGNGNDSIYGSTGGYSIQLGNGNDTVGLINSQSNIILGNGSNTLSLNGGSNNATLGDGNNRIVLGTGSDTIAMGNGTNSIITNTGNYYITGGDGSNTFNLGAGLDTILLGNGNDTLSGVNSSYSISVGNGNDSIHLGSGSDSIIAGNGNDTVSVGVGNSTITLGNGNNRLTVGTGNNTLTVGNGNDTIQTSTGNNLIIVGTGQDIITDVGGSDTLQLASGVSYQDIWLMKSGNNLIIDEYKENATITVTNWFASNYYQLASIESGDGKILLQNQVANLVQAMAAFSPPASGSTSLPANAQATIAPLVASSWH